MQSTVLVSSFAEIAREKEIDRDTLQLIIEDVFRAMIKKRYGADDAFEIILNPDNGDIQILHVREVVEEYDLEDPVSQIEVSDALRIEEDYEVGDEVGETIRVEDFGRRAVQTALQTFRQRIRDIEKENTHREYSEIIGEIVVGEIYQTRRKEVLVIHNKTELILPKEEQIHKDRYRKGDMIRAVVKEVVRDAGQSPQVIISRTAPVFLERLFELEVPEIYDGIVDIKKVERLPGDRAKIAVVSHDERVDPVGACVGVKGSRIHAVVRELQGENIDVVPWTPDTVEFIRRALAPAKPLAVELNDEIQPPRARVTVPAEEVSLAIGRGGQNIRLASRLSGYEIDVYRNIKADEEDVEIEEFSDAIPAEIIRRLKNIGCDTAKAVLELSAPELARRTDLPEETTQKIVLLMRAEFEEAASEAVQREGITIPDVPEASSEASAEAPEPSAEAEPSGDPSGEAAGGPSAEDLAGGEAYGEASPQASPEDAGRTPEPAADSAAESAGLASEAALDPPAQDGEPGASSETETPSATAGP